MPRPLSALFPPGQFDEENAAHRQMLNQLLHASRLTAKEHEALVEVLRPFEPQKVFDASGLLVEVLGRRVGRDFQVGTPFQFFDASEAAGERKVLINIHSHLARSINAGDKVTITGLGAPFTVNKGDYIYLDIAVDANREATSARIRHGPKWAGYPEAISYHPGLPFPNRAQRGCYLELGYVVGAEDDFEFDPPGIIVGDGDDAVIVIQNVNTHLIMQQTCATGETTVVYPYPWFGQHIARWNVT